MKIFISLSLLLTLLFSCKEKQVQEALYVIDTNVEKKESLKASEIFKKVTPILLEEHEEVLVETINTLEINNNYIFILDRWTAKKLFVFDKNGKYLTHIGSIGLGPGEYLSVMDFCINEDLGEIYLLDDMSKKIHKYKLHTWEFINYIGLNNNTNYIFMAYSNNRIYTSLRYYHPEQGDNMLLEIDLKTGETKEHISAKKYNFGYSTMDSGNSSFFLSKTNRLKYTQFYMNTIFSIEKDKVYPYLTVISDNWVKKADYHAAEKIEGKHAGSLIHAFSSEKRSYQICNYLEWKDNIYLEYNYDDWKFYSVIYNKKNNEYKIYKELIDDFIDMDLNFLHANSEFAYTILDPYSIESFIEKIKNGKIVLSPNIEKREELMNLNEEQIVIFEYEFK